MHSSFCPMCQCSSTQKLMSSNFSTTVWSYRHYQFKNHTSIGKYFTYIVIITPTIKEGEKKPINFYLFSPGLFFCAFESNLYIVCFNVCSHAKPRSSRAGGARAPASRPALIGHLHCQEKNGYARVWRYLVVAGKAASAGEQNQDYRAKHASGYWWLKFLSWKSENVTFKTGQRKNIVQKGHLKKVFLN